MTMTPSAADLADANLLEAMRVHAGWQQPCDLVEAGGVLLIAGPSAFPGAFRNSVTRVDGGVPAAEVLRRARGFFTPRGRGYTLVARASRDPDLMTALQEAGVAPLADSPCMLIESPVSLPPIPAGIRVESMTQPQHVRDAVRVNAEAYAALRLPAAETRLFFDRPQAVLSPRMIGFVAYRGVEPVATAASARRQGLGELCTRLATNAGFAQGARTVTL